MASEQPTTAELIAELSGLLERVERYKCAPPLPNMSPELHSKIRSEHAGKRIDAVLALQLGAVRHLPTILSRLASVEALERRVAELSMVAQPLAYCVVRFTPATNTNRVIGCELGDQCPVNGTGRSAPVETAGAECSHDWGFGGTYYEACSRCGAFRSRGGTGRGEGDG